jgi:hypothetical protein
MATDRAALYRLDGEQRALVQAFLKKERLSLPPDDFLQLIRGIETSIVHFLNAPVEGKFREAHDALRQLYELSHDDDQPVGQLRARIEKLPRDAVELEPVREDKESLESLVKQGGELILWGFACVDDEKPGSL